MTKKKINVMMAVIFLFAAQTLQAQTVPTQKGYYMIGGNLSNIDLGLQKNGTTFGLDITPRIAWFIQDNVAFGAEVKLGANTSKGFRQLNYSIGPIARYYLPGNSLKTINQTRFFLDGNIGFSGQNSKSEGNSSVSTNGLGIGIGPGLAYFINQNVALEGLVKYNFTSNFGNSININKNSSAINIGIGFQIFLPGSKVRQLRNEVK